MEERFKPSIQEETKTEIMRSLPRKETLDEKERGTFLLESKSPENHVHES
jgi:hypothetical protein